MASREIFHSEAVACKYLEKTRLMALFAEFDSIAANSDTRRRAAASAALARAIGV
jgi:hypothetical protein